MVPAILIPLNDFPFYDMTNESLPTELSTHISSDTEKKWSPPLNLIHDFDHIDHSTLGNIDPDTNFLSNINTSICKYYTELEFNQQFPQQDYKLSMFNLNVRSLPKNIDKVKHFLEGLHYNFSILSFTETRLCDYNISTHNFNGYTHLFKTRGNNKVGGGVSMFINSRINYLCRDDIKLDLEFIDVLAIEIPKDELNTKNNIIIISLYQPLNIQAKLFTDKFTELLQFLNRENKFIFILGDFNVDTSSAMINPNITVNNFQNMFISYFYSPLIDKFTRVDEKRGTSSLLEIFTPMLLIPQVTLKVDSLKLRSLITIQYFELQTWQSK